MFKQLVLTNLKGYRIWNCGLVNGSGLLRAGLENDIHDTRFGLGFHALLPAHHVTRCLTLLPPCLLVDRYPPKLWLRTDFPPLSCFCEVLNHNSKKGVWGETNANIILRFIDEETEAGKIKSSAQGQTASNHQCCRWSWIHLTSVPGSWAPG